MAVIAGVGRLVLRPLFRSVAGTQSSELFVAATLFVIVSTGVMAAVAGLSMAFGAFIAGLLLAETEFRKAIETTVEPFKGLLLGLFYFTVGMTLDVRVLAQAPFALIAGVIGVILIKAVLTTGLARLFRLSWPAAIETGLLIGPGGEFAFVVLGLAAALGVLSGGVTSFVLALTSLTMALIPLLAMIARRINEWFEARKPLDPLLTVAPPLDVESARHRRRPRPRGPDRVRDAGAPRLPLPRHGPRSRHGHPRTPSRARGLLRGCGQPAFVKSCGLMNAPAVIVTIHDRPAIDEIVRVVRELRPDILIIARARDATHARHLYKIGVTDAVPETIEASLQLSEATLVGLGLGVGPVIASIHEKRDEFRHELQEAAGRAGLEKTHALRPKSTA